MDNSNTVGSRLAKVLRGIRNFLGFNRDSKYVSRYVRDSNVRSAIFMSAVIVILEIWLIFRQTNKYLIPGWNSTNDHFKFVFSYTSNFFLFLFAGLAIFMFSLTHGQKNLSPKKILIVNSIPAGISFLYSFLIFFEMKVSFAAWTSFSNNMSNVLLISLYFVSALIALTIIGHSIYLYFKKKDNPPLVNMVIIFFAAMCIIFGIKVSYSDYLSSNPKEIICFLTMVIYGACLLIWKPYISILLNIGLFVLFYILIIKGNLGSANSLFARMTGTDPTTIVFDNLKPDPTRIGTATFTLADWNNYLVIFKDGDLVNYITFLISLTMISVSLYHQRRKEAIKDEELEYIANYDELTGLNNYSYFVRNVSEIKNRENMRVLFINVYNFKTYNDQRGFPEGNKLLKDIGNLICNQFKDQYVCRQSDDHYIAFVKEDNLLDNLKELNEKVLDLDRDILPEIKVGSYKPMNEEDIRRAVDKARYACSTIKQDHTVMHIEYDKKMHDKYHLMQYIIRNIDNAVQNGWIKPFYQPVVWASDGALCGVEALARWDDPKRGMISPGDFVPTLEETKLIHKLDICIIENVCKDIRMALDSDFGKSVVPVSINFSRLDFELMDAVQVLEDMLKKYNIDKKYIHVEVTESALTDSDTKLYKSIQTLKELGYALWLDDFGSGYSSLNVLKDFEFDVLKIDMKFLSTFSTNPRTKPLLESVIQMAGKLGMRTLTEGVETKEEQAFLDEVHCERLQGYLFGKPFRKEEFIAKVKSGELKLSKEIWK